MAILRGMERSMSLLTGFRRIGPFRADGPAAGRRELINRDEVVRNLKILGYQHHADAIARESSIETLTGLVRDSKYAYIVAALAVRNITERNRDGNFAELIESLKQDLVGKYEAEIRSLTQRTPFFHGGAAPISQETLAARARKYYGIGGVAPSPPRRSIMQRLANIADPINPTHCVAVPFGISGWLSSIDWNS
ncbi:hypothetical protein HZC35_00165 [Candidatus Saganbacteria bacterium]|nr:hypothetical protein [Candidatus Saganbacteria bacterium]